MAREYVLKILKLIAVMLSVQTSDADLLMKI